MDKYLFVDESGDPGVDIKSGASTFFVMVAILFDDKLEMETVSTELKKLSRKLFKNDIHEFHFVNERNSDRLEFFKLVSKYNFKILVSKVNKIEKIADGNIYYKSLKEICAKIQYAKDKHIFKFDGTVSKSYKFSVEKELRTFSKNNFVISKIKFVNSKNDSLIQLADMCAGIVRRFMENKNTENEKMYNYIADKII